MKAKRMMKKNKKKEGKQRRRQEGGGIVEEEKKKKNNKKKEKEQEKKEQQERRRRMEKKEVTKICVEQEGEREDVLSVLSVGNGRWDEAKWRGSGAQTFARCKNNPFFAEHMSVKLIFLGVS